MLLKEKQVGIAQRTLNMQKSEALLSLYDPNHMVKEPSLRGLYDFLEEDMRRLLHAESVYAPEYSPLNDVVLRHRLMSRMPFCFLEIAAEAIEREHTYLETVNRVHLRMQVAHAEIVVNKSLMKTFPERFVAYSPNTTGKQKKIRQPRKGQIRCWRCKIEGHTVMYCAELKFKAERSSMD